MTTKYMTQLNRSYANQTKLMEQSDGAKIHRPSDAPIDYSKYLRYSTSYGENDQYQYNIKTAVSWMKNTDAALVDMSDAMKTVVEKANQAQGTNTATDMAAIASEMLVQVQQCVSDANTQVNGRYLFSGQADLIQPYTMSNDKYERGLTKTLDDKQAEFFNTAAQSGDLTQMLVVESSDGDTYYLNTMTGDIYTKEFVDEGYKGKIANGQKTVTSADAVATVGQAVKPSAFFEGTGVVRTKGNYAITTIAVDPDQDYKETGRTTVTQEDASFGSGPIEGKTTKVLNPEYDPSATTPPGSIHYLEMGKLIHSDSDFVVFDKNTGKYKRTIAAGEGELYDDEIAYFGGKTDTDNPQRLIYDTTGKTYTFATVNQYIVTYQGDRKQFSMVKENGAAQPATDSVNAGGIDIAGSSIFDNKEAYPDGEYPGPSGSNAFNDLLTVVAMCERDDSRWMSSDSKTLANNSFNTVNIAQTVVAARQQVYTDCEEMLVTQSETILEDITTVHSTDVAKLAVEMMTAQTIYNLSLSVGSRVIPPTLADYL
ncbi:MAG: hypothetical protein IJU05_01395 [Schwartzia sp.]|nr:hypothetical protein [Schwartzia sp. (in: firmicutes)]